VPDISSTTSAFITTSGVYQVGIFIVGILLAFYIIERVIGLFSKAPAADHKI
jgi:hypothetical protein